MIKTFSWKENDVYFVPVTESVSTVIQLYKKPYVIIFNEFRENSLDDWQNVDLNEIKMIRVIRVLHVGVKYITQEKIKRNITPVREVKLPTLFIQKDHRKWMNDAKLSYDLVYIDPEKGDQGMNNEVVEADILGKKTWKEIEKYELANYHVDYDLMRRLYLSSTIRFGIDPWHYYFLKGEDVFPAKNYEEFISLGGIPYKEKD